MIRGWLTVIPSWRGRDGIRIPEFGSAVRTCRGGAGSESAGSVAMVGVGITGDSIGEADTRCTAAAGTTPAATRFTTGAISTGQEARVVLTVCEAELDPVLMPVTGLRMEMLERAAELATVPAQRPGPSTETRRLREDTRRPAVKAASDPARLAAILTAGRPGATPREAAPVWARRMPVEDLAAVAAVRTPAVVVVMAVAGAGNRSSYYVAESAKCELERSNATHHPEFRQALSRDFS